MHLFYKNPNVDLFNVLQIIRIQSGSGEGVQSLIKNIAEKRYGFISKRFREILNMVYRGIELEKAIDQIILKEKNKYFHILLNSFKLSIQGNIDLGLAIDEIELQILNEQKTNLEEFITHTGNFCGYVMYGLLIPFIYLVIVILNWVFTEFFENGKVILDEKGRFWYFMANTIVLALMLMFMRYRK